MMKDYSQQHFKERIAMEHKLRYIALQEGGNIGVICNGGGYGMATNDLIKLHGGNSANFMDIGGQAYHEQITAALNLMQKDEEVYAIYINMFGGMVPADKVAIVIADAYEHKFLTKPMIVRLKGNKSTEAMKIIKEIPNQNVKCVEDMDEATK